MTTDREVFHTITAHAGCPRVLYYAEFSPAIQEQLAKHCHTDNLAEHYGMFQWTHLESLWFNDRPPVPTQRYYQPEELPPGTRFNPFGVAKIPSACYHFTRHLSPLRHARSLADIEAFPLDDLSDWDNAELESRVKTAHAAGKVVGAYIGDLYETAWQIRGYEPFLTDMASEPRWAFCLLERIAGRNMVLAEACARAGVDLIQCGDDVAHQQGLMFSRSTWQSMIHSHWKKIWRRIKDINPHARIWYHSDGNITDIIGDLVDAGVDILNPLQPECIDIDTVFRNYGNHLTIDGTIGTQSLLPFGTADTVYAAVTRMLDKYGRNGGLILSPTHVLEPDVPLANIEAFFTACQHQA